MPKLIDDSTMLYEILNVKIHNTVDEFGEEVIDKCSRLLGARRVYLRIEMNGEHKYFLLGFRDRIEAEGVVEEAKSTSRGNIFLHEFGRGIFYVETTYRIDCSDRRVISSFASRVEEVAERFAAEKSRLEFERLKVLVNSIPDAVVVVDSLGKIVDVNDRFSKITGLSPSEVIGRSIKDLSCLESVEDIEKLVKSKNGARVKVRIYGSTFEINSAPVLETDKFVLVMRDITDLEIMNRRLQTLVDCLRSYIFMKDKNLKYILVNKSFANFLRRRKEEIIGRKGEDLLPPELAKVCKESDLKVLKSGREQGFEVELNVNGEVRFFEGYKVPVLSGMEVNSIVGVIRDVTERKKVEELRRFRTLLDYSTDAIFITDEDGRIVDMNEIARMWTEKAGNAENVKDVISGNWDKEVFEGYSEDRIVLVSVRSAKFAGKNYRIVTARDITELKRSQEKIRKMNKQLRFLNRILRHDIANNLTSIIGFLEMYKENGDRKYFDRIEKIIDNCVDLIQKVRNYETMIAEGSLSAVNVRKVLKKVLENIRGDGVEVELSGDECEVVADEFVTSVFENIVNNAIQHNTKSKKKVSVEVRCCDDYVEVRIKDNGPGIPDSVKERIFEEGFIYGLTGRTGIGLYIVKSLMEKYGGTVKVEDNEPEGSVFVLKFRRYCK